MAVRRVGVPAAEVIGQNVAERRGGEPEMGTRDGWRCAEGARSLLLVTGKSDPVDGEKQPRDCCSQLGGTGAAQLGGPLPVRRAR
jgi:hypothetical protein